MKRFLAALAALVATCAARADTGWHLYVYDPAYAYSGVLATMGAGLDLNPTTLALTASAPARSFAYPTRALNTCFQVSATRDALVSYGVDITTTLTLANGGQGSASLRTYTDSSCSLGGQTVVSGTSGLPTTLSASVGLQNLGTVTLSGVAPAGLWERLETTTNVGTVTFATRQGQETLL